MSQTGVGVFDESNNFSNQPLLFAQVGGTGRGTYSLGDMLYASSSSALSSLSIGSSSQVLKVVAGIPSWGSLATVANTGSYNDLSNKPSIPLAQVNSDWNSISGVSQILNKPSLASVATTGSYNDLSNKPTIPAAQIQSDWNQADTNAVDYIKNKPSFSSVSQSSSSRNLNTGYQPSTTRWCFVNYSVDIACVSTLLGGGSGSVFLDIASNSGFTTNLQTISSSSNTNSVSLAIAITVNQMTTATICGWVPPGYYFRIRTVTSVGSPTFTYKYGQEVLI